MSSIAANTWLNLRRVKRFVTRGKSMAASLNVSAATKQRYILEASQGNAESAQKLAQILLDLVHAHPRPVNRVLEVFEEAKSYPYLKSGDLYLTIGNALLAQDAVAPAVEAYVRASEMHPDNKFHAGQKLYDYIDAKNPARADLRAIATAVGAAKDFHVPDLFNKIVEKSCELEPFVPNDIHEITKKLDWGRLASIGSAALADGRHSVAMRAYRLAAGVDTGNVGLRLQMGVTEFLAGNYRAAEQEWSLTEYLRDMDRARWGLSDVKVRFLGRTWFAAIGHVAAIDTYLKSMALGWRPNVRTVYILQQTSPPPGMALVKRWAKHIDVYSTTTDPAIIERKLIGYAAHDGENLHYHDLRKEALTTEFWSGPDSDGKERWYGPLGAAVERAWKDAGRGPLLEISPQEHATTRAMLEQIYGLPKDAWFVGLHVREPGFHADWHKKHPGTRHADIATYNKVIDYVIGKGGWVVRLGDQSMSPIQPQKNVIDYAVSPFRTFDLDVYLCAACKYFVGTNSGLSLVPPLFGTRSVLTNWSPIAIPNWYLDDLYIPKLVRDVKKNAYLGFKAMYASAAGWTQWQRDYVSGVQELEDNSPEDILDSVMDLHEEIFDGAKPTATQQALIDRFNAIAVANGGYIGSRIGTRFIEKYSYLLDM